MASGRKLVIVESPAKARTIAGYLGSDWDVEASVGHIRDIPTPSEMPAEIKKGPFGKFGVNIEDDFEPYYVVDADKKKKVRELKALLKNADELYLATDEDREGEAIAWHLLETLQPTVPVKRMVFHEITKEAIQRASTTTRDLDTRLVDAQETRRILDRLYGYEVSPVLWRKVKAGLSAGRVQSVATRLVVERERERMAFRAASYWDVEGDFTPDAESNLFTAKLTGVDGSKVATGRDFADDGTLTNAKATPARRGRRDRHRQRAARRRRHRHRRLREALHPPTERAVHDEHPAAGGLAQAAAQQPQRDAGRPAALRERLHHLHADRQHLAVGVGADRRPHPGARDVRRRVRARRPAALREEGQERAGGARGDPPRR